MTARSHTHASNRAKHQDSNQRVVFKSVLDNPFRIGWGPLPVNLQNALLSQFLSALEGLSEYRNTQKTKSRKRRRSQANDLEMRKKRRIVSNPITNEVGEPLDAESPSLERQRCPEKPDILRHLFVGINEVTRRLEVQAREARLPIKVSTESPQISKQSNIVVLFVCKDDIDPPILINHLPHLVAAYNSANKLDPIKVVTLPKGSEVILAAATGLRRLSVVGIDSYPPLLNGLRSLLDAVPVLRAPWLSMPSCGLITTHIKQVRTSAPANIKASKEKRAEGRRAAKARRIILT